MGYKKWFQRIFILSEFVTAIILGAYTQTYPIPVFYFGASIILMFFAYYTRNWKWISAFLFFCVLVSSVASYFLLLWIGYELLGVYIDNLAMLYEISIMILLITLFLFHYYYTNWRYPRLIKRDDFTRISGRVHVLYLGHTIFLLVVSAIMLIVNSYFVNFYFFFCFQTCDVLRIIGAVFGILGHLRRGIYYCTCYYRPLCFLATIIGLGQAFLVFLRYELIEDKMLQYLNSAIELAIPLSAIICNCAMRNYNSFKTI